MTGTLRSDSVSKTGSTQRTDIDVLWLEFKVAAQFAKMWDRAEENVALIRRKEMSGTLPTQDDLAGLAPTSSRGGSPSFWMQQVGVPAWFIRDELGIGSSINVFDTAATLRKDNAERESKYAKMLQRLADARKVLSRSVRG